MVIVAVVMDSNYTDIFFYEMKCTFNKFSNLDHYLILFYSLCSVDFKAA